jgi:GH25 family lysozyme M1 (1,4-beta-N-acetylmuramidase)
VVNGRIRPAAVAAGAVLALLGMSAPGAALTRAPWQGGAVPAARHPYAGAPHSPRLLRQLAGGHGPSGPAALGAAAAAGALEGVDVASYQHPRAAAIDWAQVAAAGIQFAAIKATEGTYYQNPYALSDIAAARAAGLSVMAYAFAIPNGDGGSPSATAQADYLISYLSKGSSGVPAIMLDIEYDPYNSTDHSNECYGLSTSAMVSWIAAFAAEVQKRTGHMPIIYAPPSWWQDCTGGSGAFAQTPLWAPYVSTAPPPPAVVPGWANWAFWQYTSTGTVPGIASAGHTDLDQLNPAVLPLLSPGSQSYQAGAPELWQLRPADPVAGQAVSYSASGLPAGVLASTGGDVTGWPAAPGTGTATVTATATVTGGQAISGTVSFPWTVVSPPDVGQAGLVRLDFAGMCLREEGDRSSGGTPAEIWTCDSASAAQRWTYVQDGTLRISGMCMTIPAGASNGTRTLLEPCAGAAGQQWRTAYPGALGSAPGTQPTTLVNPGTGMCLTDPGWSRSSGTHVEVRACTGAPNQAWTLPAGPIASQIPGKCAEADGGQAANGTRIALAACDGWTRQSFTVAADGTLRVYGRCLDVSGSGTASGTPAVLQACDGSAGESWHLVPVGGDGDVAVMLVNPHSGLCLADPADATASGTGLQALACSTADPGMAWRVS